jgi:hypothetical protein
VLHCLGAASAWVARTKLLFCNVDLKIISHVKMMFWVVILYGLAGTHQRLGETYCSIFRATYTCTRHHNPAEEGGPTMKTLDCVSLRFFGIEAGLLT